MFGRLCKLCVCVRLCVCVCVCVCVCFVCVCVCFVSASPWHVFIWVGLCCGGHTVKRAGHSGCVGSECLRAVRALLLLCVHTLQTQTQPHTADTRTYKSILKAIFILWAEPMPWWSSLYHPVTPAISFWPCIKLCKYMVIALCLLFYLAKPLVAVQI